MNIESRIKQVVETEGTTSRLSEEEVESVLEVARWALDISHENLFPTALGQDKLAETWGDAVASQVIAEEGSMVDNYEQRLKHLTHIGKSPEEATDEGSFLASMSLA